MNGLTRTQRSVVELSDRGLNVDDVALLMGIPSSSVREELDQISRMVRTGLYSPEPLPIEVAAVDGAV